MAYDAYIDGIYYDFNNANKTAQVTCLSTSNNKDAYSGYVVIPESVTYNEQNYAVTSIGHFAFENCAQMTNISIGEKIESIGSQAFNNCSGLTDLVIPNSVKTIGRSAFAKCSGLTTLYFGTGITDVYEYAFYGCDNLTTIEFHCKEVGSWFSSNGITTIKIGCEVKTINNDFGNCNLTGIYITDLSAWCNISFSKNPLTTSKHLYLNGVEIIDLTIPHDVTAISAKAFNGGCNISSVVIPNNVTSIGEAAFYGCEKLKKFVIEDCNERIKLGKTFIYLCPLEEVYIGRDITTEENNDNPFKGKTTITKLTLGKGMSKIANYEFQGCTGISQVSIPNNIISIGCDAFDGCNNLAELVFEDGNEKLSINTYSYYSNGVFNNCPLTKFYLGRDISYNEQYSLFRKMAQLTDVTIGKSVTTITKTMFDGCGKLDLKSLAQTPPSLTNKLNVTSLEVPHAYSYEYIIADYWKEIDTIYTIKDNTMYFPVPVFLDGNMFVTINELSEKNIEVNEGNQVILKVSDPILARYGVVTKGTIDITEQLIDKGDYTFIASPRHTENHIFVSSCSKPTEISLNESGTLINLINTNDIEAVDYLKLQGEINGTDLKVLSKMSNLKYLDLSEVKIVEGGVPYYENYKSMTNIIGDYFLKDMFNLQKINLPNTITKIGKNAFQGCSNLRKISIPSQVMTIDDGAFSGCNKLATIILEDAEDAIIFNSTLSSIPFSSCPIVKLHIGRNFMNTGVTSYMSSLPFRNKSLLSELTFGKNVTEIFDNSFKNCEKLKTLTLPDGIATIGESAFAGCKSLVEVHSNSQTPPVIKSTTFDNSTKSNACLYVPIGSKYAYWLAPYWDGFAKIIEEEITSSISEIAIKPSNSNPSLFGIDGKKYSTLKSPIPRGLYIINGKKVMIK